jgi:hypothetical protein
MNDFVCMNYYVFTEDFVFMKNQWITTFLRKTSVLWKTMFSMKNVVSMGKNPRFSYQDFVSSFSSEDTVSIEDTVYMKDTVSIGDTVSIKDTVHIKKLLPIKVTRTSFLQYESFYDTSRFYLITSLLWQYSMKYFDSKKIENLRACMFQFSWKI